MPSGRRRTPPEPVFFLDRGLGRYAVAAAIRSRGFHVVAMFEVYPDGEDQKIGDDEWIARASEENWIALTKDDAIRRDHPDALATSRLRVFALNNANLTGDQMAERYLRHLNRIVQRAALPGPYVYVVSAAGRGHQQRPAPSAQRFGMDQTLRLGDDRGRVRRGEAGGAVIFDGAIPQLCQARSMGRSPRQRVIAQLGRRRR